MAKFLMSGVPQGTAGKAKNVRPDKAWPKHSKVPKPMDRKDTNVKKNMRGNLSSEESQESMDMQRMMELLANGADENKIAEMMMASEGEFDLNELNAIFQSTHIDSGEKKGRRKTCTGEESTTYKIGDTVMMAGGQTGKVAYLGEVEYSRGTFAGLVMPPGQGKNDGMVKGVRYFTCPKGCGLMLKTRDIMKKV